MNYIYLLLFTVFYLFSSTASTLEEALRDLEIDRYPVAGRILAQVEHPSNVQDTHPLKKKANPSLPNSPGKTIDAVIKERRALQEFVFYLREHIANSDAEKENVKITPLNSCTVLRAALQHLSVGPAMHFKGIEFFNPWEDDRHQHAIVQIDINPWQKDKKGNTNLERMLMGKSPKGPDGKHIHLHHVNQKGDLLMEVYGSTHQRLSRDLHFRRGKPSEVNRPTFNLYRGHYWTERGLKLQELLEEDALIKRKISFNGPIPSTIFSDDSKNTDDIKKRAIKKATRRCKKK